MPVLIDRDRDAIQLHEWNKPEMASTSGHLIHYSALHLGTARDFDWRIFRNNDVIFAIAAGGGIDGRMAGRGYDLVFRWPKITQMKGSEFNTWHEEEPYFQYIDRSSNLLPSDRSRLWRTQAEIMAEMAQVYHMDISMRGDVLRFSKEYYAKPFDLTRATLLDVASDREN